MKKAHVQTDKWVISCSIREEKPGPCFVWIQRCYGQAPGDDPVVHRPVSAPTLTQSYSRFLEGSTLPGVNILVARSWESLGGSGWEGKGLVERKEVLREGLGLPGWWQEGIYRICSRNNLISNRKGFNILITRMTVHVWVSCWMSTNSRENQE